MNKLQNKIDRAMLSLDTEQIRFVCMYVDTGDIKKTMKELGLTRARCKSFLDDEACKQAIWYLQKQHQLEFGVSKTWKTKKLLDVISACIKPKSPNFNGTTVIKAIHELNLMDGDLAAQKVEHSGDIVMNIAYDIEMPVRGKPVLEHSEIIEDAVVVEEVTALESVPAVTVNSIIPAAVEFAIPI